MSVQYVHHLGDRVRAYSMMQNYMAQPENGTKK